MSSGYALALVALLFILLVKIIQKLKTVWIHHKQNKIPTAIQLREMQSNLQLQVPAAPEEEISQDYEDIF